MDSLQCPDEPYTINPFICRGRQAKGYLKCPSCSHREVEKAKAPAAPLPVMAHDVAPGSGRELEPAAMAPVPQPPALRLREALRTLRQAAPRRPAVLVPSLAGGGGALGDLRSLARRIYDYF